MATQATARLKYISIPPRKMRLVADMVKGMPVEKALNILNFSPRIAAHHLAKTLKSAAANALSLEGTDNLRPEDLWIKSIVVDDAPTQKRIRFQSMGRIYRYRKRFSHLTVILEERPEPVKRKAVPSGKAKAAKADEGAPAKKTATRKTAKKTAAKKTTAKKAAAKKTAAKKKTETGATAKKGTGRTKKADSAEAKSKTKAAEKKAADTATPESDGAAETTE